MAFRLKKYSGFRYESQRFMGRNQLVNRLASQVGSKEFAENILIERGHMNYDGSLTREGMKRNSMTAAERAIDRASRRTGRNRSEYTYNPKTNKARLKHG